MRFITFLGARVGFERTFYQVNESVGTVELCAVVYEPNISCPIEFAFNITFETSDISAGTCMSIVFLYQSHFAPTMFHVILQSTYTFDGHRHYIRNPEVRVLLCPYICTLYIDFPQGLQCAVYDKNIIH